MAAVSVLVVVLVSLLVARIGTVALTLTGLSRESARFQARSAFFGVGFTTNEAEAVVGHPVRRRIIMWLILLGNAGVVTTMGTLLISFAGGGDHLTTIIVLVAGIAVLAVLAASRPVDVALTRVIHRALQRWSDLDVRDWSGLLQLEGGYTVAELEVEEQDWIAGRTLAELTLRDEGIVVLGVHRRGGGYVGAPDGDNVIRAGDVLTVYGREDRVEEIDRRAHDEQGDRAHEQAVAEQARIEASEEALF
jgi:TrkA-C domain